MKQFSTGIVCHLAFFFRVGKKERKSLIQTSVSVYCHTGHSLKLSRSFCHSCIGYLYQNNHFQLKGKSRMWHIKTLRGDLNSGLTGFKLKYPLSDLVEPPYTFELTPLNALSKPSRSPLKIFSKPFDAL